MMIVDYCAMVKDDLEFLNVNENDQEIVDYHNYFINKKKKKHQLIYYSFIIINEINFNYPDMFLFFGKIQNKQNVI